jgi:hypothetical protein
MPDGEAGRGLKEVFWGTLFGFLVLAFCIMAVEADLHSAPSKQQPKQSDNNQRIVELSARITLLESEAKIKHSASNEDQNVPSNTLLDASRKFLLDIHVTDLLLVFFTAMLAFKTSGLHRETVELRRLADTQRQDMLRSILAAEKSANAAKVNSQLVIDTERARFYCVVRWTNSEEALKLAYLPGFEPVADNDIVTAPSVDYWIKNIGRSPAILAEINWKFGQNREDGPGVEIGQDGVGGRPVLLEGEETPPITRRIRNTFTQKDKMDAINGKRPVIFEIEIKFSDTFGRSYKCCWEYRNIRREMVAIKSTEDDTQQGEGN